MQGHSEEINCVRWAHPTACAPLHSMLDPWQRRGSNAPRIFRIRARATDRYRCWDMRGDFLQPSQAAGRLIVFCATCLALSGGAHRRWGAPIAHTINFSLGQKPRVQKIYHTVRRGVAPPTAQMWCQTPQDTLKIDNWNLLLTVWWIFWDKYLLCEWACTKANGAGG